MVEVKTVNVDKSITAILEALQKLSDKVAALQLVEFDSESIAEEFAGLQDMVVSLRDLLALKAERSNTADFLKGMAASMIQVQKKLDEHNRSYLAQALADQNISPAQFRLPRLEAELRFALEKVTSEEWDIFIYSKGTEAKELNQQTLKAEIVAAPPPPELLEKLRAELPSVELVLAPNERDRIRMVVAEQATKRVSDILLPNWKRVLIIRHAEPDSYALFLTLGKSAEQDLGIWHVQLNPPKLSITYSYTRKPFESESTESFRHFLNKIIERQILLLERLGTAYK